MKNKKNQCQRLSNHYTAKSVGNTLETEYHQISFSVSTNLTTSYLKTKANKAGGGSISI